MSTLRIKLPIDFEDQYKRFIKKHSKDNLVKRVGEVDFNKLTDEECNITVRGNTTYLHLYGNEIKIGLSKNVESSLLAPLTPFGKEVDIEFLFTSSTTKQSKHRNSTLTTGEMVSKLKDRMKSLQVIFNKEKVKTTLRFKEDTLTCYIEYKRF